MKSFGNEESAFCHSLLVAFFETAYRQDLVELLIGFNKLLNYLTNVFNLLVG